MNNAVHLIEEKEVWVVGEPLTTCCGATARAGVRYSNWIGWITCDLPGENPGAAAREPAATMFVLPHPVKGRRLSNPDFLPILLSAQASGGDGIAKVLPGKSGLH